MPGILNPIRDADTVFERDFLETRGKILEVAAALDRLDRAPGGRPHEGHDPRMGQLLRALEALMAPGPDRAETIQLIFSDEYDPTWPAKYEISPRT